jgi:hypothetical protein
MPISAFFALNAASFFLSACSCRRADEGARRRPERSAENLRGFAALRPLPVLATAVVVLGLAVTLSSGTWIVGVPELVRSTLGLGAGQLLARRGGLRVRVDLRRRGARALPGASQGPREHAGLGALPARLRAVRRRRLAAGRARRGLVCGVGQGSSWVLINSARRKKCRTGSSAA